MIDGNQLREEFGRYLAEHKATRWGMDAALMHVCKIAYDAGRADGPGAALHSREYEIEVPAEPGFHPLKFTGLPLQDWRDEQLPDMYDRIAEAHDASMDEDHTGCRAILKECMRLLAAAPTTDQFRAVTKMVPAPAGVPMPKPVAYGFGNTAITGHTNRLMMVRIDIPGDDQYAGAFWLPLVLADEAHTYGVACRAAGEAAGYTRGLAEAGRDAAPLVQNGEVLVTVTGLTGSGKSAIAGEIEIMCRALGLEVEWGEGAAEKHLTHADWTNALEMYRPRVRIVEANIPRTDAALRGEVK